MHNWLANFPLSPTYISEIPNLKHFRVDQFHRVCFIAILVSFVGEVIGIDKFEEMHLKELRVKPCVFCLFLICQKMLQHFGVICGLPIFVWFCCNYSWWFDLLGIDLIRSTFIFFVSTFYRFVPVEADHYIFDWQLRYICLDELTDHLISKFIFCNSF